MRRSYSSGSAVDRQMDALVAPTNVGPTLLDCADALHGTPYPGSHSPARLCRCTTIHCMVRYTTLLDTTTTCYIPPPALTNALRTIDCTVRVVLCFFF